MDTFNEKIQATNEKPLRKDVFHDFADEDLDKCWKTLNDLFTSFGQLRKECK